MLLSERLASLFVALVLLPAATQEPGGAPLRQAVGPQLPAHTVFEPRFETPLGDLMAGTGFVVAAPGSGSPTLVTPHQLFTAREGLDRDYDGDELRGLIRRVEAYSVEDCSRTLWARPGPSVAGAAATRAGIAGRDVALFRVTGGAGGVLTLATAGPSNGQRVWLYARVGEASSAALYPAIVEASTTSSLRYRFEDPNLALAGARGAPIVDVNGHVVAMNVSARLDNGYLRGMGNPVEALRRVLGQAFAHRQSGIVAETR